MATKNSGIKAVLSLDGTQFDAGLEKRRDKVRLFSSDMRKIEPIRLTDSIKLTDTFTTEIDAGTKAMSRMKLQAESLTTSVAKGMAALNNTAAGLGAGLHIGSGAVNPRRLALPGAMTPHAMVEARRAAAESTRATLINNGVTSRYLDDTSKRQRRLADDTKRTNREFTATASGSSKLGTTLLNLGYVADDAAYGMRGILNNVAPLVMGMGMGAGVAGAVQILAVTLNYASKWWDEFTGATKRAKDATRLTEMAIRRQSDAVEDAERRGEARATRLAARNQGSQDFRASQDAASGRFWQEEGARNELAGSRASRMRSGETGAYGQLEAMKRRHAIENAAEDERSMARTEILVGQMGANNYNKKITESEIREMEAQLKELKDDAPDRAKRIKDVMQRIEDIRKSGSANLRVNLPALLKQQREDEQKDVRMKELEPAIQPRRDALEALRGNDKDFQDRQKDIQSERKIFDLNKARRAEDEKAAQEDIFRENAIKWVDGVQRMKEEMSDWSREQSNVVTEIKRETAARREASRQMGESNRIARLSAGGHTRQARRAQNTETARQRVNELMATGRFTQEQAEEQARSENPETGRIRRLNVDTRRNTNAPSGIDAGTGSALDDFRRNRGVAMSFKDTHMPTPREAIEAARKGAGSSKSGEQGAGVSGPIGEAIGLLRDVASGIQQLITGTSKTPAERAAPLR